MHYWFSENNYLMLMDTLNTDASFLKGLLIFSMKIWTFLFTIYFILQNSLPKKETILFIAAISVGLVGWTNTSVTPQFLIY